LIVGIIGPEGAGKSLLMTWYMRYHLLNGGRVLTFPGYQVYGKKHTEKDIEKGVEPSIASEEIPIEQWISLSPELSNVAIAIDELQNFFHSYMHNTVANRLFSMGIAGQRRKRNLIVYYTMQLTRELPPTIRERTHFFIYCWDRYWRRNMADTFFDDGVGIPSERGVKIEIRPYDNLGTATGFPGTPCQPWVFSGKDLWLYYDSYAAVDTWHAWRKVEIKSDPLILDGHGQIIDKITPEQIQGKVETLMEVASGQALSVTELLPMMNLDRSHQATVGRILKDMGATKYTEDGRIIYELP
jgi:hypothetical protein